MTGSQPKWPSAAGMIGMKNPMPVDKPMYHRSSSVGQVSCGFGASETTARTQEDRVDLKHDSEHEVDRDACPDEVDADVSHFAFAAHSRSKRRDHEVHACRAAMQAHASREHDLGISCCYSCVLFRMPRRPPMALLSPGRPASSLGPRVRRPTPAPSIAAVLKRNQA